MKRPDLIVHGLVALAWLSCCFAIAIKIALLGNEEAAAGKQRGADFKTRTELTYEQERLRADFDRQACVPAIDQLPHLRLEVGAIALDQVGEARALFLYKLFLHKRSTLSVAFKFYAFQRRDCRRA